jgi:hypothetical protein
MSQPTLIARIVPRVSKKMFGKYKSGARVTMSRLLDAWEEIVAPEDALAIRPVRVTWKKTDTGSEGTLHMAAPSALAAKLVYQEAVITGRVNRLFGLPEYGLVKRIAVTHDRQAAIPAKAHKKPKMPLSDDTQKTLDTIEDPVLKDRLKSLAEAMS